MSSLIICQPFLKFSKQKKILDQENINKGTVNVCSKHNQKSFYFRNKNTFKNLYGYKSSKLYLGFYFVFKEVNSFSIVFENCGKCINEM